MGLDTVLSALCDISQRNATDASLTYHDISLPISLSFPFHQLHTLLDPTHAGIIHEFLSRRTPMYVFLASSLGVFSTNCITRSKTGYLINSVSRDNLSKLVKGYLVSRRSAEGVISCTAEHTRAEHWQELR
jgi:hypothetical protein